MSADLLGVAGVAAVAFASTNVDNLLITSAQVAARAGRVRRIFYGQITGTVAVVVVAAVTAFVLFAVPARWVGLLGLVPLALGVRALLALRDPGRRARQVESPGKGFVTAALVTMGAGGDSLAVYIPVFRAGRFTDGSVTVLVFAALEALLCVGAMVAGRRPAVLRALNRAAVFAIPVLYLAAGVMVMARSGTFTGL